MTSAHAESSDEMLMVRYKRGDRDAFAELVRRYQRPLFNFSLRYVGSRQQAADVTQEAFLRVVKRSADFKHESRFSTWLFAITRNLCIDEIRRLKHRTHASLDLESVSSSRWLAGQNPERETVSKELRDCIENAVASLPEDQKEVFLLRQLGGVPFAEIALIVEASENTVKSRMRYALDKLQRELSDFEEYARALR